MKKLLLSGALAALLSSSLMAKDVSTYEYAAFKNSNAVKSALTTQGFQVVGEYDAMSNPDYHVIAYTNAAMQTDASKDDDNSFAAVEKVLVDKKDNTLVFTNPEYFMRAFIEDDYSDATAKSINSALSTAFGRLTGSTDGLDEDDIKGYHFMMGMPYYEDMIEVAKGKDLVKKLKTNAGDNIVFEIKLKEGTLFGVAMPTPKGEKSYVTEIKGQKSAAFLPYMVFVETKNDKDEAKIMHPKYYLALSYPKLSMGQFMSISSTPGDIEEYFEGLFK